MSKDNGKFKVLRGRIVRGDESEQNNVVVFAFLSRSMPPSLSRAYPLGLIRTRLLFDFPSAREVGA